MFFLKFADASWTLGSGLSRKMIPSPPQKKTGRGKANKKKPFVPFNLLKRLSSPGAFGKENDDFVTKWAGRGKALQEPGRGKAKKQKLYQTPERGVSLNEPPERGENRSEFMSILCLPAK